MKKDNIEAIKGLLDGINYIVQQSINNAPFDKTYTGVIKSISDNTYTVAIGNIEYTNVRTAIGGLSVGNTVKIIVPQNQMNQMFIYAKLI